MKTLWTLMALSLMAISPLAHAASPFGLDIGSSSLSEVRAMHKGKITGTSKWTDGAMYTLDTAELDFAGLKQGKAIFDLDERLVGLVLTFSKDRFDSLNKMAAENYSLKESVIPFVGNKFVTYVDGTTYIELSSPHMSFDMTMEYTVPSLQKAFEEGQETQRQTKKQQEENALFGGN